MKKLFLLSILLINITISYSQSNKKPLDFLEDPWVDSLMNSFNLEEKVAQLFMVAAYSNKGPEHQKSIEYLINKYKIGGLLFFQGDPTTQLKLTHHYQEKSEVPLMIAIDGEWGLGMRLDHTISYPRQMMLGAIENDSLIYQMGADIARQLKRTGIHINFAPVVDVNNNLNNPVINSRSFGEIPINVANKSNAYIQGMQSEKVIATAKHFPGHGDTDKDSHKTLPVISHDRTRLDSVELVPFRNTIDSGVYGIMVAHLNIPALEEDPDVPSTLSKNIVTHLLKEELNFDGLIFTDALNMHGVTQNFNTGEIEAEALYAGNDILLFPVDVSKAISKIKRAIRHNKITREQIDKSCRKVLAYKKWLGLDTLRAPEMGNIVKDLNKPEYLANKSKLIEASLTLLKNENNLIPLKRTDTLDIAVVSCTNNDDKTFRETTKLYKKSDGFSFNKNVNAEELIDRLTDYDLVLVSIEDSNNAPWDHYGIRSEVVRFVTELSQKQLTIVDIFANPYSLEYFSAAIPSIDALIMSYEDSKVAKQKSVQLIFGGIQSKGKLTVSSGPFHSGDGIFTNQILRLSYGLPEEAGMCSDTLNKIDSIVNKAIEAKAMPGCQVLVTRRGKVVYRKSFGYHTYMRNQAVEPDHIYDIASITKIAATVPSLMQLNDKNLFDLNKTLGDYLPDLNGSNKSDLLIKDVLTHQARLNGWIPFYFYTLTGFYPEENLRSSNFSIDYPNIVGEHFYLARNYTFKENIFSGKQDSIFQIEVSKDFYMNKNFRDTIYKMIAESPLLENNGYRYSDLGFYYFQQIIENTTHQNLDEYAREHLYKPLGADRTMYNPLDKIEMDKIVPTEYDEIFRNSLLHGYVHDPGAAMLGGVGGHAGVFTNADDLAKIMQMYLWHGKYGGIQFIDSATINLFTTSPYLDKDNRRALGFDKPQMDYSKPGPTCHCVSARSFGHSGFTGTLTWADPAEETIYVFLSNRIHPDQDNSKLVQMNIRTDIQQIIYNSIKKPEIVYETQVEKEDDEIDENQGKNEVNNEREEEER